VAGGWRRLHNEGLLNLKASPNIIIRVIKSRGMGWTGYVPHMKEINSKFWSENRKGGTTRKRG